MTSVADRDRRAEPSPDAGQDRATGADIGVEPGPGEAYPREDLSGDPDPREDLSGDPDPREDLSGDPDPREDLSGDPDPGGDQNWALGARQNRRAEPGRSQQATSRTPTPLPPLRPHPVPAQAASPRSLHRRANADPVKALMRRHRELCERAIDPLEIAAGLEAHGVTDRAAARYRHKDVFALAEEMYARVPRNGEQDEPIAAAPTPTTGVRGAWALLALVPGAVCALTLLALAHTSGTARVATGVVGALAGAVALRTALRHGPLRATIRVTTLATRLWSCWLLAYALLGDDLLIVALSGGPDDTWPPATAPLLALTVAVAPAAWCAGLYSAGARRRLASSRGLAEFAASARPLLLSVITLSALALTVLLGLSGALLDQDIDYLGAGSLGVLLLLARLLIAHGRTHAPAVVLGAAAAVEILAVASVFAARLPGCDALGAPVETAVDALGAGVVPGVACGGAALALLVHAMRTLTRASAHASADSAAAGGAP
ncbi:hypothetical protein [Streptomyces sp. NPDC016845]|uniref:hypothetical protein n=1 Tax=Streptomyces sp. NPDC016845 TaxID=3364972 RepID=UPI00379AB411